jgi:hypothetical protein
VPDAFDFPPARDRTFSVIGAAKIAHLHCDQTPYIAVHAALARPLQNHIDRAAAGQAAVGESGRGDGGGCVYHFHRRRRRIVRLAAADGDL